MTRHVLDSSALISILLTEPGHEIAARLAPDALLSSVNLAEIITKCIEKAVPTELARQFIRDCGIDVVDFDAELAVLSGELYGMARKGVLSLGDRACIATAMKAGAIAVTADRVWTTLDLPCGIELIR